jgi:hypothetical protein
MSYSVTRGNTFRRNVSKHYQITRFQIAEDCGPVFIVTSVRILNPTHM